MNNDIYRKMISQSSMGYALHKIVTDESNEPVDYIFMEVNPAFEIITGLKSIDITGKKVTEILPGIVNDQFNWIKYYGNIAANDVSEEFEQYSEELNKWFFVQVTSPVKDYFITIFSDITERKMLEEENKTYKKVLMTMKQPVIFTDVEGEILDINNAFTKMYGYSRNDLIGQTPKLLNPGLDTYRDNGYSDRQYDQLFDGLWKSILDPGIGTWEDVVINKTANGDDIWVDLLINAFYDENRKTKRFIALPIDITKIKQKEKLSKVELYQTIASLAELRDDDTGFHMRRVGIFARLIAENMQYTKKYCNDIEIFAPMHDIGKVGISDSILLAERKLTQEEFSEMKTHTQLGFNIVKEKKELDMVADITLNHHERFDGNGYPNGKKSDEIPSAAKITTIADVYDALRSKRPYKDEWSHAEAVEELNKGSGKQFDPDIIRVFNQLSDSIEKIYEKLN